MASGKAGSLLIDIAANTAQLRKDMDEAKTQIAGFGRAVENRNGRQGRVQIMGGARGYRTLSKT